MAREMQKERRQNRMTVENGMRRGLRRKTAVPTKFSGKNVPTKNNLLLPIQYSPCAHQLPLKVFLKERLEVCPQIFGVFPLETRLK